MIDYLRFALKNSHNPGFPFLKPDTSRLTLKEDDEPKIRAGLTFFYRHSWHFIFVNPHPDCDSTLTQLGRFALRFTQLPANAVGSRVRIWVSTNYGCNPTRPLELRFNDTTTVEPFGPKLVDGIIPPFVEDAITSQKFRSGDR